MNKKTLTFLIIFLLLIGGALGVFYYFFIGENGGGAVVTPGNSNLFPFGNSNQNGASSTSTQSSSVSSSTTPIPRLRQLGNGPLGGETSFTRSKSVYFRYIERATGHIFEVPANALENNKVTDTTIPKIYESLWTKDGNGTLLRYLKDDGETIVSFYATIGKVATGTSATLGGNFLSPNIKDAALSPTKTTFAYVLEQNGGAALYTADSTTLKPKILYTSPLREWLVSWPNASTITLTTKPWSGSKGFVYAINAASGAVQKILSSVTGLTALMSRDTKRILYSSTENQTFTLHLLTIASNTDVVLPFKTLPEKCVWSEKNPSIFYCAVPKETLESSLPDMWYQGRLSFTDDVWAYDSVTGSTESILTPADLKQSFDVTNPTLDPTENYLLFQNKKDLTGWVYRLTQ